MRRLSYSQPPPLVSRASIALEHQFQTELDIARIVARTIDRSQIAAINIEIYVAAPAAIKITAVSWVIEGVQEFSSELRLEAFRAKALRHAEVNILRSTLAQLRH